MSKKVLISIYVIMAVMLVICLFDMPYGFYQLTRFVAMCVFVLFAYFDYKEDHLKTAIVFIVLALLFQPFLKVELGRAIWNIVDVIVAIYLSYRVVKFVK